MKAAEKLRVATSYLILHHPFIAAPLLRLKLVPEPCQPTAAVDGRSIFYNEDFVTDLSSEGTIFLLAHEVLHVTLAQHLRRGDRNPKAWNAAGDYVIDLMLQKAGYTLIPDILLEPLFAGWSTERVYRFLIGKAEQSLAAVLSASPASSQGLDDFIPEGAGGRVVDMRAEDGQKLSQAERSQEEGRLLVSLKQALQAQAMLRGEASIQPFARCVEPRSPAFDARAELAEFVRSTAGRDDYTWRRPNPRYLPAGVFVPSLAESRALTDVVVAIDTSSSVTPELLSFMAGACDDLLAAYARVFALHDRSPRPDARRPRIPCRLARDRRGPPDPPFRTPDRPLHPSLRRPSSSRGRRDSRTALGPPPEIPSGRVVGVRRPLGASWRRSACHGSPRVSWPSFKISSFSCLYRCGTGDSRKR